MSVLAAAAPSVPVPSVWGVALSVLLVVVAGAVVLRERLGLARELAIAAVRAAVQLVAIGFVLQLLLEQLGLPGSLAWVAGMVVVAGSVSAGRGRGLPRVRLVATVAIAVGTVATLGVLLALGVIQPLARVVLPLGGMVVSASMQGATLTLLRLRDEAMGSVRQVEARLSLGLTAHQAFSPHLRAALRGALVPVVDATKTVGLISLPGAMTGLIIAGVSPVLAIRYQIVVMYMILGAGALAALVSAQLARRMLFDDAQRMRPVTLARR